MSTRVCEYDIEGRSVAFEVEGETTFGEDEVILSRDDDLTRDTAWASSGFVVEPFMDPMRCSELKAKLQNALSDVTESLFRISLRDHSLTNYHRLIQTDERHLAVLDRIKEGFPFETFPFDLKLIERRVSEICGATVTVHGPPTASKGYLLRIVRPLRRDNNPPHRDVWLDRLRNAVNLYFPVAGSNSLSSLSIMPGSHRWPESRIERTKTGAKIVEGFHYTVPSVVGIKDGHFSMQRPDPSENEALVFSPYLVHGGAANFNSDLTRVSLEMRFWRVR